MRADLLHICEHTPNCVGRTLSGHMSLNEGHTKVPMNVTYTRAGKEKKERERERERELEIYTNNKAETWEPESVECSE